MGDFPAHQSMIKGHGSHDPLRDCVAVSPRVPSADHQRSEDDGHGGGSRKSG